jgi:apolipoprotein N-acyltransferase
VSIDILLAAVSGVALALSFPQPDFSFLAWFALVPLLLVMRRAPFRAGFIAGVAFFACALYWLNIVMVTYGRLHPFLSLIAYLLLVLYLALFFAVATWLASRLKERLGYPVSLTLPIIWIALELLRSILLTGFPWVLLGYSQHENLPMIQSVDLFGVYGISGLIILSNCVIAAFINWLKESDKRFYEGRYAIILLLLLAANYGYGTYKLGADSKETEMLSLALIQGNIDQTMKWAPENQFRTIETYNKLSAAISVQKPDLLIWPESATPFYFQDLSGLQQAVIETPLTVGSSLLTGSPAYEKNGSDYRYFNSAFLVSPQGQMLGRSDKVHLVPFGEYVPLGQFFPFIDKLVYGIGDFSAGEIKPLNLNGHSLGVLICYEAIFPELARAYVNAGSSFLVNITNDAWFGRSSAPYQHLAMSRFRAIENRRWLVRSANTGISAIINPSGQIVKQTSLFEEAALAGSVELIKDTTLYSRFGDVLPLLFLLVSTVWFWQSRLRR